jgi:hypothetical protein
MLTWIPAFAGMTGCVAFATDGLLDCAIQYQAGLRCFVSFLIERLARRGSSAMLTGPQ